MKTKPSRPGASFYKSPVLKGLFMGRIRNALDPEMLLKAHVRTLKDMTEDEIQSIELKYGCPVKR